jgi:hypothetical protein
MMKAAQLRATNDFAVVQLPIPVRKDGEVLIKVLSSGIRGQDGKDLIVTTSGGGIDLAKEPLAGQLLVISDTGYSGSESTKFNG